MAPHFPKFHPKDSPDLVDQFQVDSKPFEFWHREKFDWVNASSNTPRRDCESAAVDGKLHYRSKGVKRGPGMPSRGIQRPAEESSVDTERPFQRFCSMAPSS